VSVTTGTWQEALVLAGALAACLGWSARTCSAEAREEAALDVAREIGYVCLGQLPTLPLYVHVAG
jgi:hypothetical protein